MSRCKWKDCDKLFKAKRVGQVFCSNECGNADNAQQAQTRAKTMKQKELEEEIKRLEEIKKLIIEAFLGFLYNKIFVG